MKKFFTLSLCLLAAGLSMTASAEKYKLVTDLSEVLNKDVKFIMVTSKARDGKFYAAKLPAQGGASLSTVEVYEGDTQPTEITIANPEDLEIGLYQTSNTSDNIENCLYNAKQELYIATQAANLNISVNPKTLTFEMDEATNGVKIVSETNKSVAFMWWQNAMLLRNPFDSWFNTASYSCNYPAFYVDVTDTPSGDPAPEFTGVPEKTEGTDYAYDLKEGESANLPAIEPADLEYTFVSGNTDVVTVDNNAKTLKAVGPGEATITFTTEAVDGKYAAGKGEFKVYVSVQTGVIEIGAAAGEARYYDLNGREIKGNLEKGIYVRLQDGKATKVIVK